MSSSPGKSSSKQRPPERFAVLANPQIAEACLVDGMSYDAEHSRLVKTHEGGIRRKPTYIYLDLLDAPIPGSLQAVEEEASK